MIFSKAQAATEMIIILAVGLAIVLVIVASSQDVFVTGSFLERSSKADLMLEDISNSVTLVHSQGEGAKTRVYVTVPENIETAVVYSDRLEIRFDENNIVYRSFAHNLTGSLPTEEGNTWVNVEELDNETLIYADATGHCGNNDREANESCDGSDLGGHTCASQGFTAGDLGCYTNCTFNTESCTICGDGLIEGTEQCEGADLNGQSCVSLGYDSGNLSCTSSCSFNTSECVLIPPPMWLTYGVNNTESPIFELVQYFSQWTGEGLDDFIFSWNASGLDCGTWYNYSSQNFQADNWTNTSLRIPFRCGGQTIGYRFYANNTYGKWNSTPIGYVNVSNYRQAMIVYYDSDNSYLPQYRTWNGTDLSSASSAISVNEDTDKWDVLVSAPSSNERILGTLDNANEVNVQVWNGLSWGSPLEVSSNTPNDNRRQFDLAYEQSSGDALVVFVHHNNYYRPRYRIWDGSSWSAHQYVQNMEDREIKWITLVPKPGDNEIILATINDGRDIWAQVWDGSSWSNEIELETNTESHSYQSVDIAYESLSGDALVVWSNRDENKPRYNIWNGSGWWTDYQEAQNTGSSDIRWIKLAADPNSDMIVMGALNRQSGNNRLDLQVWDGSSWGSNFQAESSMETSGDRNFDVAWESLSGRAMVVYGDRNNDYPQYRIWDGSWSSASGIADLGGDSQWIQLASNPDTDEILGMIVENQNNDAWFLRWNGTDWTAQEVEDRSNSNNQCFYISYNVN